MPVSLIVEPLVLAVCRLEPDAPVPPWASGGFLAITRTQDELSIICEASQVPPGIRSEAPWGWLRVEGPLPFSAVGILARLTAPLAEARIPVLAIATFDTDHLLVPLGQLEAARDALRGAGCAVEATLHPGRTKKS